MSFAKIHIRVKVPLWMSNAYKDDVSLRKPSALAFVLMGCLAVHKKCVKVAALRPFSVSQGSFLDLLY